MDDYFIRNNCKLGYTSNGSLFYSIPAGKYSSTISQEDADAKAWEAAQNYVNSKLGCKGGSKSVQ